MTKKKYVLAAVVGLALCAGCGTRNEAGLNRGTMGYETGSASDNSGTTTETQKKARGTSETGTTDNMSGSNERSSTD